MNEVGSGVWRSSSEGDRDCRIDAGVNFQCKSIHNYSPEAVFIFIFFILNIFYANELRSKAARRGFSCRARTDQEFYFFFSGSLWSCLGAGPAHGHCRNCRFDWQCWNFHIFFFTNLKMECHPPTLRRQALRILSPSFISPSSLLRHRTIEGIKIIKGFFLSPALPLASPMNSFTHPPL